MAIFQLLLILAFNCCISALEPDIYQLSSLMAFGLIYSDFGLLYDARYKNCHVHVIIYIYDYKLHIILYVFEYWFRRLVIQVHDCCIDVHYSCTNKSVFLLTTFTVAIKSQSRLLHDFSNASAIPADRLSQ